MPDNSLSNRDCYLVHQVLSIVIKQSETLNINASPHKHTYECTYHSSYRTEKAQWLVFAWAAICFFCSLYPSAYIRQSFLHILALVLCNSLRGRFFDLPQVWLPYLDLDLRLNIETNEYQDLGFRDSWTSKCLNSESFAWFRFLDVCGESWEFLDTRISGLLNPRIFRLLAIKKFDNILEKWY